MPSTGLDSESRQSRGLLGSLRDLADGLLGSARDRLELFALELQEEKLRFFQTFIWVSAAIFAAMLVVMFASLTIVYLFWQTARVAVLVAFTVVYLAAFLAILRKCRRMLDRTSRPFEATLAELQEDRGCLRPEN
jgi:uncharacterized membrane protein YqjE